MPRPERFDAANMDMLDDKLLLKRRLQAAGLPVPRGGSAVRVSAALRIFRSVDKPVIVKPRTGSRGRHTTTYIYTEAELIRAVKIAKQLCVSIVVEEQLFGPVYRATVIGGKLAGVLRGDPPQVAGDSRHTIQRLIEDKNARPHPGVKDIAISEEMRKFVGRELNQIANSNRERDRQFPISNKDPLAYVPEAGEIVNLSEKIGVNYGGSSSEDYDICHPDNRELFLKAAAVAGDPLLGFDFIIPDIAKSYKEQRAGFIEVNTLPFINLHHDPLLGAPRNAAALVWDMVGW